MGDELLRKLQLLLHGAVGTAGSRVGQVQSKDVWEERSEVRHMVVGACIKYYYVVIEGIFSTRRERNSYPFRPGLYCHLDPMYGTVGPGRRDRGTEGGSARCAPGRDLFAIAFAAPGRGRCSGARLTAAGAAFGGPCTCPGRGDAETLGMPSLRAFHCEAPHSSTKAMATLPFPFSPPSDPRRVVNDAWVTVPRAAAALKPSKLIGRTAAGRCESERGSKSHRSCLRVVVWRNGSVRRRSLWPGWRRHRSPL